MTLPAGKYYVGDLCYVLHSEWNEVCDLTIRGDGVAVLDGEFQLSDGRRFAIHSTAYGDGEYYDDRGRSYGVDAGVIGCVLLSDVDLDNKDNFVSSGQVIDFNFPFDSWSDNGIINFGIDLEIDTAGSDYEEEYDDE